MTLHQKILQKFNMLFLWGINFELCYRKLIRSSLRFGMFLMGLVLMGLEWICFFCVSLSCLHFACVFALSRFFWLFRFCVLPVFLFPLIFVFFPRFSLFFFVFCIFVSFYSFQEIWVFSAHFQAAAVDCPSVFGYGKTAKTRKKKKGTSLRPRLHQLSETFQAMLLFQDSDPMTQALGWPMIRERIPLRQATGPLQKKIPQKYFDVMLAPIIA